MPAQVDFDKPKVVRRNSGVGMLLTENTTFQVDRFSKQLLRFGVVALLALVSMIDSITTFPSPFITAIEIVSL